MGAFAITISEALDVCIRECCHRARGVLTGMTIGEAIGGCVRVSVKSTSELRTRDVPRATVGIELGIPVHGVQ